MRLWVDQAKQTAGIEGDTIPLDRRGTRRHPHSQAVGTGDDVKFRDEGLALPTTACRDVYGTLTDTAVTRQPLVMADDEVESGVEDAELGLGAVP